MRLFKATYRDRQGEVRKSSRWYVEIKDHLERRRRLPAYENRKASEDFGRKVEALVACRLCGERPDGDLRKWLEGLSPKMTAKLVRWGLLDGTRAASSKGLMEHATDYRAALLAKGDTAQHAAKSFSMVKRTGEECRFRSWSDVSASRLQAFLADMRAKGRSIRTSNAYLTAFKGFARWCVRDGRLGESPVAHLQKLNEKTDARRQRRALTAEECRRLLAVADPGRALLYRLALETGLRANELRTLTVSSFDLSGAPPTVTVSAKDSKHRREDVLPLRLDTAALLRQRLSLTLPAAPAFDVPRRTAETMQQDLKRAGIPYVDESGKVADFHSLRHTFITSLANAGIHPSVAQALARHSTITLTMDRYTHSPMETRTTALEALPDLSRPPMEAAQVASGTDDRICLGDLLSQNKATKPDSSRPIQTTDSATSTTHGAQKHPMNTEESGENGEEDGGPAGIRTRTSPRGEGILSPLRLPFRHWPM